MSLGSDYSSIELRVATAMSHQEAQVVLNEFYSLFPTSDRYFAVTGRNRRFHDPLKEAMLDARKVFSRRSTDRIALQHESPKET